LRDLISITGRSDRTKFRHQVLNPLLGAGLIEMTIPDKPTCRLQKYRLPDHRHGESVPPGGLPGRSMRNRPHGAHTGRANPRTSRQLPTEPRHRRFLRSQSYQAPRPRGFFVSGPPNASRRVANPARTKGFVARASAQQRAGSHLSPVPGLAADTVENAPGSVNLSVPLCPERPTG